MTLETVQGTARRTIAGRFFFWTALCNLHPGRPSAMDRSAAREIILLPMHVHLTETVAANLRGPSAGRRRTAYSLLFQGAERKGGRGEP